MNNMSEVTYEGIEGDRVTLITLLRDSLSRNQASAKLTMAALVYSLG